MASLHAFSYLSRKPIRKQVHFKSENFGSENNVGSEKILGPKNFGSEKNV